MKKVPKALSREAAQDPVCRIEHALIVVERAQPGRNVPNGKVFTEDDMIRALEIWQNNPQDWMDETTLHACDKDHTRQSKNKSEGHTRPSSWQRIDPMGRGM